MSYCQDCHDNCIAFLCLGHAEAALEESYCMHCAELPMRVLKTHRNVSRGLFGVNPTATSEPLVGPSPRPKGESNNLARSYRPQ